MHSFSLLRGVALAAAFALTTQSGAFAQAGDWPNKQVRVIAGTEAGSSADIFLRAMGDAFAKKTGQSFIVENIGGGRQVPAVLEVMKAPPDGYTFLQVTQNAITLNPLLIKDIPYKPLDDLEMVSLLVNQQHAIIFRGPEGTDWKAWKYKDLVEYSKANPGKIFYGSIGIGSGSHLSFEWQKAKTGADYTHVPYGGNQEVFRAFRSGDIHLFQLTVNKEVVEMIETGEATALGVPNKGGNPRLPGVPTFTEAVAEGYEYLPWTGWFAPKGTPLDIRNKVHAVLSEIINEPAFMETFVLNGGYLPVLSTPDEFRAYLVEDAPRHKALLDMAGIETN